MMNFVLEFLFCLSCPPGDYLTTQQRIRTKHQLTPRLLGCLARSRRRGDHFLGTWTRNISQYFQLRASEYLNQNLLQLVLGDRAEIGAKPTKSYKDTLPQIDGPGGVRPDNFTTKVVKAIFYLCEELRTLSLAQQEFQSLRNSNFQAPVVTVNEFTLLIMPIKFSQKIFHYFNSDFIDAFTFSELKI